MTTGSSVSVCAGQAREFALAAAGIALSTGARADAARAARSIARAGAVPIAAHERFRRACRNLGSDLALPLTTGGADLTPAVAAALADLVQRLAVARLRGAAAWHRDFALHRGRIALRAAEAAIASHASAAPACRDVRATRAIDRFTASLAKVPGFSISSTIGN